MHSSSLPRFGLALLLAGLFTPAAAVAAGPPPLHPFATITPDATGRKLMDSMVWTGQSAEPTGVAVGFRKTFDLPAQPRHAQLAIFADARYVLWVNGSYVDRGPSRFQPNGPQYDVINLAPHLRPGRNAIALLVAGNLSGGKVMRHAPGLTAVLGVDGRDVLRTDGSWRWSKDTRFREVAASWPDLCEKLVDARVEDGDWTQASYADGGWHPAVAIAADGWGALTRTLIPPLRETPVPVTFAGDAKLPVTLNAGQQLKFNTGRIVQVYPVIELEAEAGTVLEIAPFKMQYIARAGKQSHFTIDSRGLAQGAITVKSGRATITGFKLIERLYPYDRLGTFKSNDAFLNRLWEMCARSCEVLSEDSYVDCADRERVEWMDDTPPGFDITRTAMAGTGPDGKPVFSDPRLLGAMVRRTGLTLQPDGWVKAHTCSDRYDIHAKMEDRACEWVTGMRIYQEAGGELAVVRDVWPAVVAQMEYFLKARTPRGLVCARDWVVWGNPVGYLIGETTTLNVFVQRALVDAAYLAGKLGDKAHGGQFAAAAKDLALAINTVLWDEQAGGYYSGYFTDEEVAASAATKRPLKLPRTNGLTPTTLHANVFALDRGVVPAARRARVVARLLEQQQGKAGPSVMVYYYLMKQLYQLDRPEHDLRVLSLMRDNWQGMVANPWQCSWEGLAAGGGSKAHIYGMYPGYFLSSYVLGVRWRDGVPLNRQLLIQPQLGDLTDAAGTVVTEAGPVAVEWRRAAAGALAYRLSVPQGVTATLSLPFGPAKTFTLNGRPVTGRTVGDRCQIDLAAGVSTGAAN